uniref:GAF domain-containing protein n=1 Tax=Zhouia sp. PK063 TaxID=3373602 RepID=UPI0037DC9087
MMQQAIKRESPLQSKISFHKLFEVYEKHLESDDSFLKDKAKYILSIREKLPFLDDGFDDFMLLHQHNREINSILQDAFSPVLSTNEIKTASLPFRNIIFNVSKRFKQILQEAGDDFDLTLEALPKEHMYILECSIILGAVYNIKIDFKRPLYYEIPDKNGILRKYRILYNADFTEVVKTDNAPEITEKDIEELLESFEDVEKWKEKFPPNSYVFKGFVISNIFDVTLDVSISELKTSLLSPKGEDSAFVTRFEEIFRSIFDINDLQIGFSRYMEEDNEFQRLPVKNIKSFLLKDDDCMDCNMSFCKGSYSKLMHENNYFSISNTERIDREDYDKQPYKNLRSQGIKSAILAPIVSKGKLLGVLELASKRAYELNSINATKLADVMPYLQTSIERSNSEEENRIEAVIQKEYTSIHPSVKWKFVNEARRFLAEKSKGNTVVLKDILFENVHPLYGQIDIKDSSISRNEATQKDLIAQLKMLSNIFVTAVKEDALPIYEEYNFRIKSYLKDTQEELLSNSEQTIVDFLHEEIHPALNHVRSISDELDNMISNYLNCLHDDSCVIYNYRKDYDDAVTAINKRMAEVIDEQQASAQAMFPHYFERYKTDGVEHNMYIGASISKSKKYNEVYLQNLKLWQLQTMCLMENEYYNLKPQLPIALNVTSLILVHNATLSIKFRMDEKHFDVDGTYNARYEIIKKRIDKSFIKGTNERITKPGCITIVYSQKKDKNEYLRYIKLLQAKKILTDEVNHYELEELQGVSGLKAISVGVLYTKKQDLDDKLYSYNDLMKTLKS